MIIDACYQELDDDEITVKRIAIRAPINVGTRNEIDEKKLILREPYPKTCPVPCKKAWLDYRNRERQLAQQELVFLKSVLMICGGIGALTICLFTLLYSPPIAIWIALFYLFVTVVFGGVITAHSLGVIHPKQVSFRRW
jgi:hypothetical protein